MQITVESVPGTNMNIKLMTFESPGIPGARTQFKVGQDVFGTYWGINKKNGNMVLSSKDPKKLIEKVFSAALRELVATENPPLNDAISEVAANFGHNVTYL